jgi:translation initiation factor 5B
MVLTSAPKASQPGPSTVDVAPTAEANDAEDAERGEGPKLLSKKEKERLKKEKEKVSQILLCMVESTN